MKKGRIIMAALAATLLAVCQERYTPVPMQVEVYSQVEISGNNANNVRPETKSLIIVRDSVADEKADTIYNLTTSLTLILDSIFMADKMEETLQLQIDGIAFVPTDSALAKNLIAFLKSDAGTKTTIEFYGKAGRSKFLQLSNDAHVSLTGFSFHELDPEAMADPKITSLINEFEKLAKEIDQDVREYGSMGVGAARAEQIGVMRMELDGLKSKMTPKQLERFQYITSHYQTYF